MFAFALWDERSRRSSARATASASSRSTTRMVDGMLVLRLRGQGAAAVPAGDRDRPRGPARTTSPSSSASHGKTLFKGVQRAAARATTCVVRDGQRRRCGATGRSTTSSTSTTPSATSRTALDELVRGLGARCTCAPTCRSAPTSRGGLDSSIVAGLARRAQAGDAFQGFTGRFDVGPELRREPLRPRPRRPSAGFDAARGRRSAPRTSSSTIERRHLPPRLSRSPGPGSFPQYMVSQARGAARARWCSAARAATRSSAATPAT